VDGLDLGAFFKRGAWAAIIMSAAVAVHVGAANRPYNRVGDLLFADLGMHAGDRVRDLLDAGFLDDPRARARHLLDDGAGDFPANRVRDLFADTFPHVGGARNLLTDNPAAPNFAAASLRRILADDLSADRRLVAGLASARIEAAFSGTPFVTNVRLAGNAILLRDPFADLAFNRPAGLDRPADSPHTILVAGFGDFFVSGAANFLDDAFADRPADRAADLAVAAFGNRLADRIAAFAAVLFTAVLDDLVAVLLAVLFIDRPADGIAAILPAGLGDRLADRVVAFFPTRLVARLAASLTDFFHRRAIAGTVSAVVTFLPASFVARLAAHLLNLFVAGLIAGPVASFAFLAIAGLADRLHDGLPDRLVTGMPPPLQDGIVHELVAGATLLLARGEAALGVATRLGRAGVLLGTAVRCRGNLDSPKQAKKCSQQRQSQAHPHDLASSNEPTL
jgi:hypothetical protein